MTTLRLALALALLLLQLSFAPAAETKPVWLASNGFHTSIGLRARDVPFFRGIMGDRKADELLFGWGADDFYRGHVNPFSILKSLVPCRGILHVVPVQGPIAARFAHSDVVLLHLPPAQFQILLQEIDCSFLRDECGSRHYLGPGYYPGCRFYRSRDRFYFPNMCNAWVSHRLRRAGLPLPLVSSLLAPCLISNAAQLGTRQQRRSRPHDGY